MTYNTGTTPKALQQMSGNDSLALATPLLSTALQKQDLSIWLCCYKLLLDEWPLGCDTFMHLRHKSRRKAASCLRCRADLYRASSSIQMAEQGSQRCIWKRVYNLQICNILTCSCSKGRFVQLCFKAKLNKASLAAAAGD